MKIIFDTDKMKVSEKPTRKDKAKSRARLESEIMSLLSLAVSVNAKKNNTTRAAQKVYIKLLCGLALNEIDGELLNTECEVCNG